MREVLKCRALDDVDFTQIEMRIKEVNNESSQDKSCDKKEEMFANFAHFSSENTNKVLLKDSTKDINISSENIPTATTIDCTPQYDDHQTNVQNSYSDG